MSAPAWSAELMNRTRVLLSEEERLKFSTRCSLTRNARSRDGRHISRQGKTANDIGLMASKPRLGTYG